MDVFNVSCLFSCSPSTRGSRLRLNSTRNNRRSEIISHYRPGVLQCSPVLPGAVNSHTLPDLVCWLWLKDIMIIPTPWVYFKPMLYSGCSRAWTGNSEFQIQVRPWPTDLPSLPHLAEGSRILEPCPAHPLRH